MESYWNEWGGMEWMEGAGAGGWFCKMKMLDANYGFGLKLMNFQPTVIFLESIFRRLKRNSVENLFNQLLFIGGLVV